MSSKLKQAIKNFVHTLIDSEYPARQAEAEYLRTIYRDNSNVNVRRNQFYRLMNETGALVGFEYVCTCGISYQLIDINMWTRSHSCPTCKNPFDLYKACGITKDIPPSEHPELFAQLPMRPRIAGKPQERFVDTWSEKSGGATGAVEYEPYDPCRGGLFR